MSQAENVRWVWLKVMYIWTIIIAGAFGLAMLLAPEMSQPTLNTPCESVTWGIQGSLLLAFALLSILGLRVPLTYAPVLLLQLTYKVVWFVSVVLPLAVAGRFPWSDNALTVVIFALTIVGDLITIPFSYVFARQSAAGSSARPALAQK